MELAKALGRKAKELTEGMRSRVHRDPDVADFAAAFAPLLSSDPLDFTTLSPQRTKLDGETPLHAAERFLDAARLEIGHSLVDEHVIDCLEKLIEHLKAGK